MSHTNRPMPLPKGVPTPPQTPTLYTVYIGAKQWNRVAETISANPEDALIIEGTCAFDPQLNAVAVYATSVTSKLLEVARREQKQAKEPSRDNQPAPPVNQPPQPVDEPAEQPAPASVFPAHMPPDVQDRLTGLYASASLFRQKIAAILSKPADQQTGLEMTQKLLKNVEDQIAALEAQYAD